MIRASCLLAVALAIWAGAASAQNLAPQADNRISAMQERILSWQRDIRQRPGLSNRKTRTAALVAEHLRGLGMDVRTSVAHTCVVAVLNGGSRGPIVALRAGMGALPVTEASDVPFESTATAEYLGKKVGIMFACGHGTRTTILMGMADALARQYGDHGYIYGREATGG